MREPGIYKDVDIEVYHSEDGISSSGISLILDCPKRYNHEHMGKKQERDGNAFKLGSAFHMMMLEPEKFNKTFYAMTSEVDLRTKAGKEDFFKTEHEAKGRTVLRKKEYDEVYSMALEASSHSIWESIELDKGSAEYSIYWDAGIYNTRLRSRPDFFNDSIIIDLKTTDSIASFSKSVYNYGYHRQAAMQIDGLQQIDGKKRFFAFFVIEKKAPYLTACFTLEEEAIAFGRKEYLEGAAIYSECLKFDNWPGYQEQFQLIKLPNWKKGEDNA